MLSSLLVETPEVLTIRNRCCRLVGGHGGGAAHREAGRDEFLRNLGIYQEGARRDSVPSFMLRPRVTSANHKVISR